MMHRTENPRVIPQRPRLHASDELICEHCGHQEIVDEIFEPDTGGYYLTPDCCSKCKTEWGYP